MAIDTRSAALQWAPSYQRATWLQAPLAIVSFLAGAGAWLLGGGALWLVAGLFIGAVVPITFIVIMPTNRRLLPRRASYWIAGANCTRYAAPRAASPPC